jgi:N-acetylneuraminic acid mutarotase
MLLRLSWLCLRALALGALVGCLETAYCLDRAPTNSGTRTDAIAPTWVPTGSLRTARSFHTATLLPNGKVLVAGGLGQGGLYAAELYDPITGVWTDTGAMNVQRRGGHTATLLTNGQVLVVGGDGSPDVQSLGLSGSSELYDPASGTWRATGKLNTPRGGFSATLLATGKVLVAGGVDNDDNALASAELYDPVTGTWHYTGNLAVARFVHSAIRLVDGRVLVVAGSDDDFLQTTISSAEIYDPAVGVWTAAGTIGTALGTARQGVTTALLQSGKVLVAGGYANNGGTPTSYALAELFDPVTRWSPTGAMNVAREGHTITPLPGGEVLVTGGYDWNFRHDLSSTELYEPSTGTWQIAGSMSTTRFGHTATLLPSGQVLVAGGEVVGPPYANTPIASAELYQAPPPVVGLAVEYYYVAWDFYFVTASPAEAAALDAGAFSGAWKRTGQVFDVWTGPTSQAVPTCRFFNTTFAPKSSHVYTPYAAECASLKAGTAWQYEGIAFYIRLPDANGLCVTGTIPLYRAYNNGMGGAPNHRYTTSLTILNQMLAAGWIFEGNGDTKAFACVPQVP